MLSTASAAARTYLLIFGIIELAGAAAWCLLGAGIYGSPLAGMNWAEASYVLLFLVTGPVSAFGATVAGFWMRRLAATWLILGGVCSGLLSKAFLETDANILPALLVSLPMTAAGIGSLFIPAASRPDASLGPDAVSPSRPSDAHGTKAVFLGVALFFGSVVAIFAVVGGMMAADVLGLRGPPSALNPLVHRNQKPADLSVAAAAAFVLAGITLFRKQLKLPAVVLAGLWFGLAALTLFTLVL